MKRSGLHLGIEEDNTQLAHTKALGSSRKTRAYLGRIERRSGSHWKGWLRKLSPQNTPRIFTKVASDGQKGPMKPL